MANDTPAKDRHTREVEAESVAYVVCQHFGIDTSDYSFGYVAGWSRGMPLRPRDLRLTVRRISIKEGGILCAAGITLSASGWMMPNTGI